MKIEQAIKNVKYVIFTYIVNYLLKFLLRTVFVTTLSIEYLGINSLLSDIVILLSVTEMGIGTSIGYSLYKPLSSNDIYSIKAIMNLLKKAYYCIGSLIIIVGLAILPYLNLFIKDNTNTELKFYFIVFLLTDALGYFFSYKWALLISDQKQYIYNYYHCIFLSILTILQIIFLLITHSYWSFILLMFLLRLIENYFISKKTETIYPYIKSLKNEEIDKDIKYTIIKNTGALVINKLANIINSTSANIIISKYIGLIVVGLYSNYMLIINAISVFCEQIYRSIIASIGYMFIVDDEKTKINNFLIIFFITAWIGCCIFNLLFTILNDFIYCWLGADFIIDIKVVTVILILFYINYMQNVVRSFKEGAGLYWQERYRPILECFLNVVLSVYFINGFGLFGLFTANIFSRLLTSFWIEPFVLFRNSLKLTLMKYWKIYFQYTFVILCIVCINIFINKKIFNEVTVITLCLKTILCFIISNLIWIIVFRKSSELEDLKKFLKDKLKN